MFFYTLTDNCEFDKKLQRPLLNENSRIFFAEFCHPDVVFAQVIGKGDMLVIHKAEGFCFIIKPSFFHLVSKDL